MKRQDKQKYRTKFTNKELDEKIKEVSGVVVPVSLLGSGTNKNQKIDLWDLLIRVKTWEGKMNIINKNMKKEAIL